MGKSVNTNWNISSTDVHSVSRVSSHSFGQGSILNMPVRVEYKGKVLYEDPSAGVKAVVIIDQLNEGFLWIPLYKSSGFSASAYVMVEGAQDGMYWDGKWVDHLQLSGRLSLSGNIHIIGLCSHHPGAGIVQQEVVKELVAQTKWYIASRF